MHLPVFQFALGQDPLPYVSDGVLTGGVAVCVKDDRQWFVHAKR
jgi:hypothetical protein